MRIVFCLIRKDAAVFFSSQFMHMFVQTLDMMMVRLLGLADVALMADDRHAVLTQRAVHVSGTVQGFVGPLQEGFSRASKEKKGTSDRNPVLVLASSTPPWAFGSFGDGAASATSKQPTGARLTPMLG